MQTLNWECKKLLNFKVVTKAKHQKWPRKSPLKNGNILESKRLLILPVFLRLLQRMEKAI